MKESNSIRRILLSLCCLIFISSSVIAQSLDYDILIKNAKVFDGSLKDAFQADIAIKSDMIVKVAKSIDREAKRIIDANGLYVSPGFIDMHTHVDIGMHYPENRPCLNFLKQGVTTIVVGQCGGSAWPIFEKAENQIKRWTDEGIGPNAALLVGHGQVREIVMGREYREPAPEELEKMKALVKEAMEQGAYGISTGLEYTPGYYAKTEEVIELVKVVAPYGGIYHTHMRTEGDYHSRGDKHTLIEALEETIEIAKQTGVPTNISHIKAARKRNWGLSREMCALIEEARKNNVKITADQYPYRFGGNYPFKSHIPRSAWIGEENNDGLSSSDIEEIFDRLRDFQLIDLYKKTHTRYIPITEQHEQYLNSLPRKRLVQLVSQSLVNLSNLRGPANARERMLFLERMKNPEEAENIRKKILEYIEVNSGPENWYVTICHDKNLEGKTLKEIAEIKRKSIADIAIELGLMDALGTTKKYSEDDIEHFMKKDYVATASDGGAPFYGIGLTHIRSYSTFLQKIKKYAMERKTVSIPHVIRSQTSLPAQIMNFDDRGWIREGYKADIVVLDLKNIDNRASISNPHQYSTGVEYLLVNGTLLLDKGEWTGTLPGRVLKPKNP